MDQVCDNVGRLAGKRPGALLVACCLLSACGRQAGEPEAAAQWNPTRWQPVQIEQLERGRRLYLQKCAACHMSTGQGQATLGAPALKGSAVVAGPVTAHIEIVLNGRSNATMPAFGTALDPPSIAAIVSYERNAWGNHDPNLVTAAQVTALERP